MKKKIISVMIITITLCSMPAINVQAEGNAFFTTFGGVELTEFQYNTLVDMLSEERVKMISEEDYNNLHVERMIEGEYKYKTEEYVITDNSYTGILTPYAYHETTSKKLTLSIACNSTICSVASTAYWKKVPATTSYDVIGVRLENTTFHDGAHDFTYKTTDGKKVYTCDKSIRTSKGAACIHKISSNIDYIALDVNVNYAYNGSIFASYQHATKSVTLTQASSFEFKGTGFGSVFYWASQTVRAKYDQMAGVSELLAS